MVGKTTVRGLLPVVWSSRCVLTLVALAGVGLVGAESLASPFFVHTYEADSRLFLCDPDGGSLSLIGHMGIWATDVALAPDGSLFASTADRLVWVDGDNGSTADIGPFGAGIAMVGLDFGQDGLLYGVGQVDEGFYSVDWSTGMASLVFETSYRFTGDVAHYQGQVFYGSGFILGVSHLIRINAAAKVASDMGLIAPGEIVSALDFEPNGRLMAFCNSGNVYAIPDFSTSGAGVLLSNVGIAVGGASAVPEPTAFMILALGGLGAFARRR